MQPGSIRYAQASACLLVVQSGSMAGCIVSLIESASGHLAGSISFSDLACPADLWLIPWHGVCRHRAARLCAAGAKKLHAAGQGQIHFDGPAWNSNTVDTIRIAKAHSMYVLHKTFHEAVARLQVQILAVCGPLSVACQEHAGW